MSKLESAKLFAKERHFGTDVSSYSNYLEGIVNRLKSIGISDEEVFCATWLMNMLETGVTFDEIYQRFGKNVATMVMSLSRDRNLPKSEQERQYIEQLKNVPIEVQIIKLCEISSSIKELKNSRHSKTKKIKELKRKIHYLNVIKPVILQGRSKFPRIQVIIDGINEIITSYGQRPLKI